MSKRHVPLNPEEGGTHYLDFELGGSDGRTVISVKDHKCDPHDPPGEHDDPGLKKMKLSNGKVKIDGHNLDLDDGTIIRCKGSRYYFYFLNGRWYRVYIP